MSETSTVQSFVRLTLFENGSASNLLLSTLTLNTGFAPGPASQSAADRGTIDFSVVVPEVIGPFGSERNEAFLQLTVSGNGVARTFAEAAPAPVPLPPSAAFFAAGLGLLAVLRRRGGATKMRPLARRGS